MPSLSNIFYNSSIIIISFLTAVTLTYFLTLTLLNALVEGSAMFLFGTTMTGVTVINQLASLVY